MAKRWRRVLAFVLLVAVMAAATPTVSFAAKQGLTPSYSDGRLGSSASQNEYARELGLSPARIESLKKKVHTAMIECRAACDISEYGIVYSDRVNTYLSRLIFNGDPRTFHVRTCMYHHDNPQNIITRVTFEEYDYDKETYTRMMAECEANAEWLTHDLVNANLTDVQKALLLHDRLAVWVEYDKDGWDTRTEHPLVHTMYGALTNHLAVCDGYSKAYTFLLQKVGIKSRVCISNDLLHAWNIVELYGKEYHVDVTWDDPTWDVTGRVNHDNFLLSSEGAYATGHKANDYDTSPYDTYFENWFWKNSHTAFQYVNGTLYYIDNVDAMLRTWVGDTLNNVLSVADEWPSSPGYHWTANYARLSGDWDYLYYSLHNVVYRYDPVSGQTAALHYPDLSGGAFFSVYGMKVQGNYLYCDLYNTETFTGTTKKQYQWVGWYRQNGAAYLVLEGTPKKTIYGLGKTLNTDGLRVRVRYTDGTTEYLESGYSLSGFDSSRPGTRQVAVTYEGRTAYFTVQIVTACGDVDDDGAITSTDARLILQLYAGKVLGNGLDTAMADVDGDGAITSTDARLVLQLYAGKIQGYPLRAG